jgi:hypothetical protein
MFMSKTVFWANFGTGFATNAVSGIFQGHNLTVIVIVLKITVVISKVLGFQHIVLIDQIKNIARTDFKAPPTTYAGTGV